MMTGSQHLAWCLSYKYLLMFGHYSHLSFLKSKTWTSVMLLYFVSFSPFSAFQESLLSCPKATLSSNSCLWRFQPFCGITRNEFIVMFKLLYFALSWVTSQILKRILYLQYYFIFLKEPSPPS